MNDSPGGNSCSTSLRSPEPKEVSALPGNDQGRKAELLLRRIVDATHSHIDGRDLLAEIHPRRFLNITRRVDGVETSFEGDWLSTVWSAVKEAKAFLYSRDIEREASKQLLNRLTPERSNTETPNGN